MVTPLGSFNIGHNLETGFVFPAIFVINMTKYCFTLLGMVLGFESFFEFVEEWPKMIVCSNG
jgi:hypothetical protein